MSALLVIVFVIVHLTCGDSCACFSGSPLWTHLTYCLAHGNAVHLAVDSIALCCFSRALSTRHPGITVEAYIAAVLSSFAVVYDTPTVGSSAMSYYMAGRLLVDLWSGGRTSGAVTLAVSSAVMLTVSALLPSSAFLLHIAGMASGAAVSLVTRAGRA